MKSPSSNRLAQEKSPYLLQHQHNPVHWYAWGEEAVAAARSQDKPIFLSIGYSTCHWCHVMEKDSFELVEVAKVLNAHFICIKVDREERPDIDQLYMEAVIGMTGQGGWPLSVFLTPEKKPFFGGTFFWRPQFLQLLQSIDQAWKTSRAQLLESADYIVKTLSEAGATAEGPVNFDVKICQPVLQQAAEKLLQNFDAEFGGFGSAPKFPHAMALSWLLRQNRRFPQPSLLHAIEVSLQSMAGGGIYDHLGGGFARYSTDERWLVPHFEKMLYDNALLVTTYLEAYQVTGKPFYSAVAADVLNYVKRDMTDANGGFYSAEDADSEGEEGKFYVWREEELKKNLSTEEFKEFSKNFGVTAHGNFEHQTNILHLVGENIPMAWQAKQTPQIRSAMQKLYKIRQRRIPPLKDDKILTGWNGLMIAAMCKGYQVLGEVVYLQAAQQAANFIRQHLWKSERLQRRYRDGESRFDADLSDYAALIHGLLMLYESDFNPLWFEWAVELQRVQDQLFWDNAESGYFFSSSEVTDMLYRKKDFEDNATPAGNSVTVLNLLCLYGLTGDLRWRQRAETIFSIVMPKLQRYPTAYCQLLMALDFYLEGSLEVALIGNLTEPLIQKTRHHFYKSFIPNRVIACTELKNGEAMPMIPLLQGKNSTDKPTVYLCQHQSCKAPVDDLRDLDELLAKL